jgi:hypothetical protein
LPDQSETEVAGKGVEVVGACDTPEATCSSARSCLLVPQVHTVWCCVLAPKNSPKRTAQNDLVALARRACFFCLKGPWLIWTLHVCMICMTFLWPYGCWKGIARARLRQALYRWDCRLHDLISCAGELSHSRGSFPTRFHCKIEYVINRCCMHGFARPIRS